MVERIKKNVMPILMLDDNVLLGLNHGNLVIVEIDTKKMHRVCSIEKDIMRKLFSYSRPLARRYGINEIKGVKFSKNKALLNYHKRFYILDLDKFILRELAECDGANGSTLYLSDTSHGVIFGDYGYNPLKTVMSIFHFDPNDNTIKKVYTFESGKINHIHNLIEDRNSGRIWILVGDFDKSAAIYYTDDFFKSVNLYLGGSQQYRGCCGISIGNVLVYATDSPTETNHIYRSVEGANESIAELNGSVIYGYTIDNHLIVSTTVENQTDEMNNKSNNYRYNKGYGIKDWYIEVLDIEVDETITINKVLRAKKDILPMMPFKYGCFRFPSNGQVNPIITMGQAVQKYDQWLIKS